MNHLGIEIENQEMEALQQATDPERLAEHIQEANPESLPKL